MREETAAVQIGLRDSLRGARAGTIRHRMGPPLLDINEAYLMNTVVLYAVQFPCPAQAAPVGNHTGVAPLPTSGIMTTTGSDQPQCMTTLGGRRLAEITQARLNKILVAHFDSTQNPRGAQSLLCYGVSHSEMHLNGN